MRNACTVYSSELLNYRPSTEDRSWSTSSGLATVPSCDRFQWLQRGQTSKLCVLFEESMVKCSRLVYGSWLPNELCDECSTMKACLNVYEWTACLYSNSSHPYILNIYGRYVPCESSCCLNWQDKFFLQFLGPEVRRMWDLRPRSFLTRTPGQESWMSQGVMKTGVALCDCRLFVWQVFRLAQQYLYLTITIAACCCSISFQVMACLWLA